MLAKRPRALRIFSSPCSGLTLAVGSLSYFGSPIAPKRTASDSMHTLCVESGYGSPWRSIATAPISAYLYTNSCENLSATASRAFTACAVISGPMPSPGSTAIVFFIDVQLKFIISSYIRGFVRSAGLFLRTITVSAISPGRRSDGLRHKSSASRKSSIIRHPVLPHTGGYCPYGQGDSRCRNILSSDTPSYSR